MKFQTILVSALLLCATSLPAQAGKSQSILNFENQAEQACRENPTIGRLIIRPFVKAIDNYGLVKIYCKKKQISLQLEVDENPNLNNAIQVLGETHPDILLQGKTKSGVAYSVNLLKE
jgi:hypothetical protein